MRWAFRICFLLLLIWAGYMISPFWALYDLAQAAQVRDLSRIGERVNFHALRDSLSRQIVEGYLEQRDLGEFEQRIATGAGTTALNPVVEELVTPQALADLLGGGSLQQAAAGASAPAIPTALTPEALEQAWTLFVASETHGFRSITFPLPPSPPKEKQFRLTMRLKGTTWRLTGLMLPQSLREQLVQRAAQAALPSQE